MKAVRLNSFGGLKKVEQYYQEIFSGYVDVGIRRDSENHNKAIEILNNHNLPISMLVEHSLNRDFLRLCVSNIIYIDSISLIQSTSHEGRSTHIEQNLSEVQKQAIKSIYALYYQDGNMRQNNVNSFMNEWDKKTNLKTLREWWDNINVNVAVTSVGKVLAHSNAQRCDNRLPPFN